MSNPDTTAPVIAGEANLDVSDAVKKVADEVVTGDEGDAAEDASKVPVVAVDELKAVLAKIEHDIIGKAHVLYEDVKALIVKAEAEVEKVV